MKAPTPCLEPSCTGYAVHKGRCIEHAPPAWQGSYRKQTLPPDWNTRRIIVMKRDNGICHLCGNPGADTIDHVQHGDNHNLDNLAPVHDRTEPHCHRYKSSNEGHAAQQGNRTRRRY
jgi:5-methylcytosine-specific restriction protein A